MNGRKYAQTVAGCAAAAIGSVAAAGVVTVRVESVAEGLTSPVQVLEPDDGTGRLFVVDQAGQIRVVDGAGNLLAAPFLDLTSRMVSLGAFGPGTFDERGLLGMALHPDFTNNGRAYVHYSAPQPPPVPETFEANDPLPPDVIRTGGTIGTQFVPAFYCSGTRALEVSSGQSATLEFVQPVIKTRFFLVHRATATAGTVTAILDDGTTLGQVTSVAATVACASGAFIELEDLGFPVVGIKRLVLQAGTGSGFTLFFDDLEITRFNHMSRVSEFTVSAGDANVADPGSERIIVEVDQPQFNHNSGTVAFSPNPSESALYISIGDGGNVNDVGPFHAPGVGNGQDTTTLLGNILRVNVDAGDDFPADPRRNYAIPSDNPFVGDPDVRDEIFAFGIRNSFRCTFDTGGANDLFCGDAGQELFEEVNIVSAGANLGWNIKEGTHCFDPDDPFNPPENCPDVGAMGEPLVDPIIEYPHFDDQGAGIGQVVIGGYVYRGALFPGLAGVYVFGDFSTPPFGGPADGRLFLGTQVSAGNWIRSEPLISNGNAEKRIGRFILGFGQDQAGEVYMCTTDNLAPIGDTGRVFRIVPALGDFDGDGDVDLGDYRMFTLCFSGGGNPPPIGCPVDADFDVDGDVDAEEFDVFSQNLTGPMQ